jgi:tetratricopeptide (TPR) repeat protein
LQDREQYWQHRGRGDLAANVREQINSLEPVKVRDAVTPLAVPAVKDTPRVIERMVQVEVVKPVAQKPVAQKPVEQKPVVLKSVEQKPAMGTVLPTVQKTVPVKTEAPVSTSNPASTFVPVPASTSVSAPAPVRVATPVASLAPVPAVALTSLVVPVARSVQAVDSAENGIGFVSANPTRQELDERAKYWEARGRTDLSTRGQNQVKLAEAKPVVSVRSVVPVAAPVERVRTVPRTIAAEAEPVGLDAAKATSQELDDGAQYWEARGRVDLASQLRQKLQAMEPRHAVVARNTPQTALPDLEKTKNNQSVAKSVLEEALLKNPGSSQARLDLAQIYQGAGEFNKARGLIDGVLAGNPDLPVALYASAQLYAEQRLWRETLYALEKISPVSRSDEMGKLQKTAWAHVQIDRAEALVHQGNNREAEVLLRQVAVELAVNDTRRAQPETPALWTSVTKQKAKRRSRFSGQ